MAAGDLPPGREDRGCERGTPPFPQDADHVLQHRHAAEECVLLKRPPQPHAGQVIGGGAGDVAAVQHEFAGMPDHVRRCLKAGAFAGAIRADDA
jgi:hypothetical protein